MTSDFAQKIRAYVEGAYRALVFICADDRPPQVPEAATVLGIAHRTAEQLDGDVERLRSRRDDVARLPELAHLDEQVNQLSEQYRAATAKETEAKQRLDHATPPGVVLDLENRMKINEVKLAIANAQAESKDVFARLSALRGRRHDLAAELTARLKSTTMQNGDWQNPDDFALV